MLTHDLTLRLAAFVAVFAAVAAWEVAAPRRPRSFPRGSRWPANIAIAALNGALVRIAMPISAIGVAFAAGNRGWGLFNAISLSRWTAIVSTIIVLDLAIYLQHVMFHAVPVLWRLHRMHHADLDFDVTTGSRFHPGEIIISMLYKCGVVAALGANPAGVLIFEVLLNATSMFNHGNAKLGEGLDRWLRLIVVTPDMHRVHHSVLRAETNSNFGFNLPWWDRMMGTYRAQPAAGHLGMTIGIEQFRDPSELGLAPMLTQPFREGAGEYAFNPNED